MKRVILSAFLAVSILGTVGFSIASKVEAKKISQFEIVDLIGDKSALGEVKIKQTSMPDQYTLQSSMITKDGVKDIKYENNYGDSYLKDKKLFRGVLDFSFVETEEASAVFSSRNDKGLWVRYKKNTSYKEFYIKDKFFDEHRWGTIYNAFIKDDIVYGAYSNGSSDAYLIKIDLKTEKLIEALELPHTGNIQFFCEYLNGKTYMFKNNKLYFPALNVGAIRIFCYDLGNNSLTYKDIVDAHGNSYDNSNNLMFNDAEITSKVNFDPKEKVLNILNYNIVTNESKELGIKCDAFNEYDNISVNNLKQVENKIYICAIGRYIAEGYCSSFIAVLDKDTGKIDYFGKTNNNIDYSFYFDIQ